METIFAEEVVGEMAGREGGTKKASPGRQRGGTVHSIFRRNDDASNMSLTDIPVGIPESANYRPEAHVFPFLYCIGFTPNLTPHRSALSPPFFPFPSRFLFVCFILKIRFQDTIERRLFIDTSLRSN